VRSAFSQYALTYDGLNQLTDLEEFAGTTRRNLTQFSYDSNGNPLTRSHNRQNAAFEYNDPRDLVTRITNTETGDTAKVTTYGYTNRGELAQEVRPNGNTVDYTYYLDGQIKTQVEKAGTTLIAEHQLEYNANSHRTRDAATRMNADDHSAYLDHVYQYKYDPRDRVAEVTRSAAGGGV